MSGLPWVVEVDDVLDRDEDVSATTKGYLDVDCILKGRPNVENAARKFLQGVPTVETCAEEESISERGLEQALAVEYPLLAEVAIHEREDLTVFRMDTEAGERDRTFRVGFESTETGGHEGRRESVVVGEKGEKLTLCDFHPGSPRGGRAEMR